MSHVVSRSTWRKVTTAVLGAVVFLVTLRVLFPPMYSSVFKIIMESQEPKNKSRIPRKISQVFSVPEDFKGQEPFTLHPSVSPFCQQSCLHY